MAIFERSRDGITVTAKSDTKLLVMDGESIVGQGPFVMNSQAEIGKHSRTFNLARCAG